MAKALLPGRHDTLLDWLAAGFPALCAAYAATTLGPLFDAPSLPTALGAFATLFIIAFLFMRSIEPPARQFSLPDWPGDEDRGEVLLLDNVWQEISAAPDELLLDRPLVEERSAELAELLLNDALSAPDPSSRVVQLFAPDQLKQRVDRHLANAKLAGHPARHDASDALHDALAELKRSLGRP